MTTVAGITFMKTIHAEGDKPISYQLHSCVHKNNIYDISNEKGFSFIGITWRLEPSFFINMKGQEEKCILCLDDASQVEKAKKIEIPYFICPTAVFCDLGKFIYEPKEKKYNAVLNCRNSLWKRRYLATQVEKLALIYYPSPRSSVPDNLGFQNAFRANIKDGSYNKLKPEEVSAILNTSRVGLILSSQEGSPRAVVEYLLCGLPVISTRADCGRWEFLNISNCLIVEDNEESVNLGVKRAIELLDNGTFVPANIAANARAKVDAFRREAEKTAGVKLLWD
jgi:glycosyltransferase involved in cell wall biosynthesis